MHLANTMFLMGAMTGVVYLSSHAVKEGWFPRAPRGPVAFALVLTITAAAAGAVVALGDTLFPSASLAEGFAADLSPTSHFLIRLRMWHPIIAVTAGLLTVFTFRTTLVTTLVLSQIGLGVMNLMMLAPLPLQMLLLLGSNVLWIAMIWTWLDRREFSAGPTST
jgi:heme A synthase